MNRWTLLLLAISHGAAIAAPPPVNPSPAQAPEMPRTDKPPLPAELPNRGKVVSSMDAGEFIYIEVARDDGGREWIAAPKTALKAGSTIRYEDGSVMTNFYSKLLKRTFPSVMFVGQVSVVD